MKPYLFFIIILTLPVDAVGQQKDTDAPYGRRLDGTPVFLASSPDGKYPQYKHCANLAPGRDDSGCWIDHVKCKKDEWRPPTGCIELTQPPPEQPKRATQGIQSCDKQHACILPSLCEYSDGEDNCEWAVYQLEEQESRTLDTQDTTVIKLSDEEDYNLYRLRIKVTVEENRLANKYGANFNTRNCPNIPLGDFSACPSDGPYHIPDTYSFHGQFLIIDKHLSSDQGSTTPPTWRDGPSFGKYTRTPGSPWNLPTDAVEKKER